MYTIDNKIFTYIRNNILIISKYENNKQLNYKIKDMKKQKC